MHKNAELRQCTNNLNMPEIVPNGTSIAILLFVSQEHPPYVQQWFEQLQLLHLRPSSLRHKPFALNFAH